MIAPTPIRQKSRRIDWSQIVFDLERAGMSQREIGAACDMVEGSQGTWANYLKNVPGTQPKFHNGLLLLGLWASATGKLITEHLRALSEEPDELPMTEAPVRHSADDGGEMVMRPKCPECGQTLRGGRADKWHQLTVFRKEHGAGQA